MLIYLQLMRQIVCPNRDDYVAANILTKIDISLTPSKTDDSSIIKTNDALFRIWVENARKGCYN